MNDNYSGLFSLFGMTVLITDISTLYFHMSKVWGLSAVFSVLEATALFLTESAFPNDPILHSFRIIFLGVALYFSFLLFLGSNMAYSRLHDPLFVRALLTLPFFIGPILGVFLLLHIRRVREDAFNAYFAEYPERAWWDL